MFISKIYCGKVTHVSASCFITLLVHIDNDLNGPVSLLMRRWDNFGKAVSRNFDSTQRKGSINALIYLTLEKKPRLIAEITVVYEMGKAGSGIWKTGVYLLTFMEHSETAVDCGVTSVQPDLV